MTEKIEWGYDENPEDRGIGRRPTAEELAEREAEKTKQIPERSLLDIMNDDTPDPELLAQGLIAPAPQATEIRREQWELDHIRMLDELKITVNMDILDAWIQINKGAKEVLIQCYSEADFKAKRMKVYRYRTRMVGLMGKRKLSYEASLGLRMVEVTNRTDPLVLRMGHSSGASPAEMEDYHQKNILNRR